MNTLCSILSGDIIRISIRLGIFLPDRPPHLGRPGEGPGDTPLHAAFWACCPIHAPFRPKTGEARQTPHLTIPFAGHDLINLHDRDLLPRRRSSVLCSSRRTKVFPHQGLKNYHTISKSEFREALMLPLYLEMYVKSECYEHGLIQALLDVSFWVSCAREKIDARNLQG